VEIKFEGNDSSVYKISQGVQKFEGNDSSVHKISQGVHNSTVTIHAVPVQQMRHKTHRALVTGNAFLIATEKDAHVPASQQRVHKHASTQDMLK
jgi:hypothetical protein